MVRRCLIVLLAISIPLMKIIEIGGKKINFAVCDFVLILILIHIMLTFLSNRKELVFPNLALFYLFVAVTLISTLASMIWIAKTQSVFFTMVEVIKFLVVVIYFFIFYFYLETTDEIHLFFKYWVIISVFEVLLGLFGLVTHNPDFSLDYRIQGSFANPNLFAMYLNASVYISLYLYLKFKQKIYLFATLFFIFGIIVSASRGALLGLTLSFLFFILYKNKYKLRIILSLFFVALVFSFSLAFTDIDLSYNISRLETFSRLDSEDNLGERTHLWKMGIKIIENYPFLGVGKGNFIFAANNLVETEGTKFNAAHNTYISIASETGILNLLIFLGLLTHVFLNLFWYVRANNLLPKIILTILLAFVTQALVMNIENIRFFWGFLAIGFGIEKYQHA